MSESKKIPGETASSSTAEPDAARRDGQVVTRMATVHMIIVQGVSIALAGWIQGGRSGKQ